MDGVNPWKRWGLGRRLAQGSGRDLAAITVPVLVVAVAVTWATVKLVRPAPPSRIRMISGPDGSSYRTMADRYQSILGRSGIKVEVIRSRGSLDNIERLADPASQVDVGFVQGGLAEGINISHLVSLGSLFPQPLIVYYRHPEPVEVIAQLRGKRLAIGPEGSGTRALALAILKANDVDASSAVLLDLGSEQAAAALEAGTVDGVFLAGDSATREVMRRMREAPGVAMMSFRQAEGYVRRLRFLSSLTLPEGAIDLGRDYPPRTVQLVGPTVELIARHDLHPAISDLLIRAAREVHGGPGWFRKAGDYPVPLAREFPISTDAERYYKAGGHFLYEHLPFWLASLVDRLLVVVIPLLVVLVPSTRLAPAIYRWRVRSRIYRWYGALMAIEGGINGNPSPEQREELHRQLDEIQQAVNQIRTPLAFADQLYLLRSHVAMVRGRLDATTEGKNGHARASAPAVPATPPGPGR